MLAVALAGSLAATGALAQTKPVDKASQKFISSAIGGDIAEVDFGKLAQEKGQSDAVRQYGAMLVKDHGDHKAKVEQVANELGRLHWDDVLCCGQVCNHWPHKR